METGSKDVSAYLNLFLNETFKKIVVEKYKLWLSGSAFGRNQVRIPAESLSSRLWFLIVLFISFMEMTVQYLKTDLNRFLEDPSDSSFTVALLWTQY